MDATQQANEVYLGFDVTVDVDVGVAMCLHLSWRVKVMVCLDHAVVRRWLDDGDLHLLLL